MFDSKWVDNSFFYGNNVALYNEDCLEFMDRCNKYTFDMIYADPPYFLSNGGVTCHSGHLVSVNKGEWDKSNGFQKDYIFNYSWIYKCQSLLKKNGSLWISGTQHNIFTIGYILQLLGFKILNDIVWFKPNASPNLSCKYFTHSHEHIIWARLGTDTGHKYNYKNMKYWKSTMEDKFADIFKNDEKQMRSVWCISATPQKEKTFGSHPTQKPEELLKRIILSTTDEGDMILDPFIGSGTTAKVGSQYNRYVIGVDSCKDYLEIAKKRILDI